MMRPPAERGGRPGAQSLWVGLQPDATLRKAEALPTSTGAASAVWKTKRASAKVVP
jgi:hypothetical protein